MRHGWIRLLIPAIVVIAGSGWSTGQEDPATLREALKTRESEQKELEEKKRSLETQIEQREQRINRLDQTLRIYEINLERAQNVIDTAEAEIAQLNDRRSRRQAIARQSLMHWTPESLLDQPPDAYTRAMQEAVMNIAETLLQEEHQEKPRLDELAALVTDRKAYQQRIRTRYMPADAQKKESYASRLDDSRSVLEETAEEAEAVAHAVQTLKNDLEASQRALEQLMRERAEAERKRREDEEKRQRALAAANPTPTAAPTAPPVQRIDENPSAISRSDQPFSAQKGRLPWPLRGKVVQPYGTFQHHTYNIEITNTGIDVRVSPNALLRSAAAGTVFYVGTVPGMGPAVIVSHDQSYMSVYGNVFASVAEKQSVSQGDILGRVPSSPGENHADYHFAVLDGQTPENPILWLAP